MLYFAHLYPTFYLFLYTNDVTHVFLVIFQVGYYCNKDSMEVAKDLSPEKLKGERGKEFRVENQKSNHK